jgi:hypothetical protein
MSFIIVCIDKEDPKKSEIVPVETTDKQIEDDEDPVDCQIFPTKANAERWVKEDEKEFKGVYDYHIIQVG